MSESMKVSFGPLVCGFCFQRDPQHEPWCPTAQSELGGTVKVTVVAVLYPGPPKREGSR